MYLTGRGGRARRREPSEPGASRKTDISQYKTDISQSKTDISQFLGSAYAREKRKIRPGWSSPASTWNVLSYYSASALRY